MNPVNGTRRNMFIDEMLPTALICQSKAPTVLMQSDMPIGRRSSARRRTLLSAVQSRQMSFKHATVRHQSTKFAPLRRPNYRSHGIRIFSDLWFSLIVFGNISENKITLTKVVSSELLLIYVFSHFPFGIEGRMWDLTVSVPDQCLYFYFKFSHRNRKCAKWMEIFAWKMDWHSSEGYGLPGQCPKRRIKWYKRDA